MCGRRNSFSRASMWIANLGVAQVSKTTYDARDFQTKVFSKMKGFKGDEKAWPDWQYKEFPSGFGDFGLGG